MTIVHSRTPLTANRAAAAALAPLGAASAIPIPLAQFDFAGLVSAFNIDSGDSPRALRVIAGVGGTLTVGVLALALVCAVLALAGAHGARNVLIAAALAGLVTAMPLWIPAGVVIGAAAFLLGQAGDGARVTEPRRNLFRPTGVSTGTRRRGDT
jgi:hypothetical protein